MGTRLLPPIESHLTSPLSKRLLTARRCGLGRSIANWVEPISTVVRFVRWRDHCAELIFVQALHQAVQAQVEIMHPALGHVNESTSVYHGSESYC